MPGFCFISGILYMIQKGRTKMLRTFLVEDEVIIRENIKRMVPWEKYGFELVGEAADGEMALPLIRKSRPDILITDSNFPHQ